MLLQSEINSRSGSWLLSRRHIGIAGSIGPAVLILGLLCGDPKTLFTVFGFLCGMLAAAATLMAIVSRVLDPHNKFDGREGYMTRRHYNSLSIGFWFSTSVLVIGSLAA